MKIIHGLLVRFTDVDASKEFLAMGFVDARYLWIIVHRFGLNRRAPIKKREKKNISTVRFQSRITFMHV